MAKRRENGIDVIASLPWPAGMALGLIAYAGIRYGIGWILGSSTNPFLAAFGKQGLAGAYTPLAWLALGICWLGALFSYIGQRKRKLLLETQTGLDSLRAMSWQMFELLVGEAFRRQGYTVTETGLGGADGGIDLIIKKNGSTTLVQCKQWRHRQVTVKVVREMYGLLAHHGAAAVKIVATGDYTADARRFALGKPIELIHGDALLEMIRAVQTDTKNHIAPHMPPPMEELKPDSSAMPVCPKCGGPMTERKNRRTSERFWGCSTYPKCIGTRPS